jgi:hypothetical protein
MRRMREYMRKDWRQWGSTWGRMKDPEGEWVRMKEYMREDEGTMSDDEGVYEGGWVRMREYRREDEKYMREDEWGWGVWRRMMVFMRKDVEVWRSMNEYLNEDAEAKVLVPDWGDIVGSGIGLSYRRHAAYAAWRASATTLCQSQLHIFLQSGTKNLATKDEGAWEFWCMCCLFWRLVLWHSG